MKIRADDMLNLLPEVNAIIPDGNFELAYTGWITLTSRARANLLRLAQNKTY